MLYPIRRHKAHSGEIWANKPEEVVEQGYGNESVLIKSVHIISVDNCIITPWFLCCIIHIL